MTDEPRPGDVFEIEPSQSEGLLKRLPWWLIGSLAALVAELTAHPSIGVVVLCLKFGWNDFQTALWLRRRDPIPLRGRICSWFYGASSLWRICISGFALMFVLAVILGISEARQAPVGGRPQVAVPPMELITSMIVWMTSAMAAALVTTLALVLSRKSPSKIWISPVDPGSRQRNEWPPQIRMRFRPPMNVLKWWLILTTIAVSVPLAITGLMMLAGGFGAGNPPRNPNIGLLVCTVVLAIVPLAVTSTCAIIESRLAATSPFECWLLPKSENSLEPSD